VSKPKNSFPKAVLDSLSDQGNYRVMIESIHPEHEEDALLRRFKDKWLFLITALCVPIFLGFCGFVYFTDTNPEHAALALNAMTGVIMALAGYYVHGKNN
jgi:hypothetical protein